MFLPFSYFDRFVRYKQSCTVNWKVWQMFHLRELKVEVVDEVLNL